MVVGSNAATGLHALAVKRMNNSVVQNTSLWRFLLAMLLIAAVGVLAAPVIRAAPALQSEPITSSAAEAAQPIDVVVVLDDSGSMATCWPWPREGGQTPFYPPCASPSPNQPSDPNNLRYSAARLLAQLADPEDRLAVIRFDTVAEGVGDLGNLQIIGSESNRQALISSIQPPTDYLRRGYTRLDLGLQMAIDLLEGSKEAGRNQFIVLLTDGEPTHPNGLSSIQQDIAEQVDQLVQNGVLAFPVVLCNPTAGCQGEFLREVFADFGVSEATTAESVLRIFSYVLTEMKPNRSVISGRGGSIQLNTRASQAVASMSYVTELGGLLNLQRNDEPTSTQPVMGDANIQVSVVDSVGQNDAQWRASVADGGGFVVVEADSYPELVNPPPSLAESAASTRYYPAGKRPLLIARGVGPAAGEPLSFNGPELMQAFGLANLHYIVPDDDPGQVRLQLGEDKNPLQLIRTFRVEPKVGLPTAKVLSPTASSDGRLPDGRTRLQVGFDGQTPVESVSASVYVFETDLNARTFESLGASSTLVHTTDLVCSGRTCTDESFLPQDGHSYIAIFILEGVADGLRFSDWAQTSLSLEPAVYLRGLPESLDLAQMPDGGWPIDVASGTVDEIGLVAGSLMLRDSTSGDLAKNVSLDFMPDVPEEGSVSTTLYIEGLGQLSPGAYEGEITLQAKSPAGLPMDVQIRPAATIPVSLTVPRPVAHIRSQILDFGDVLFDTSPNFRLNEEALVTVDFSYKDFPLSAQLVGDSCPNLTVTAGEVENLLGKSVIPLRLTSTDPVQPGSCSGQIMFSGPDGQHDVVPSSVDWQLHVSGVEWSLVDGALDLGDLQDAGTQIEKTVRVRFSGKTPFLLQMSDIEAAGSNVAEGAPSVLSSDYIDMPSVEVSGPVQEDGTYLVPLTFMARQAIPHDALRGSYYTGQLGLSVAGLDSEVNPVDINFRSPSIYQRYAAPIVVPVYSMPWALCTAPLTLLLLLVIVARTRGRGFDQDEVEQVAMAKAVKTMAADAPESMPEDPIVPTNAPATAAWGGSEWGGAWTEQGGAKAAKATKAPSANGHSNGLSSGQSDPWSSSW